MQIFCTIPRFFIYFFYTKPRFLNFYICTIPQFLRLTQHLFWVFLLIIDIFEIFYLS